MMFRIG